MKQILETIKEHKPCKEEWKRLINAETDQDRCNVIWEKWDWILEEKVKIELPLLPTTQEGIYNYCYYVQDREELWSQLKADPYILDYCQVIEDRPELWQKLKSEYYIYRYCRHIQDHKELWSKLTDNEYIYRYCKYVKDRPELRKRLK